MKHYRAGVRFVSARVSPTSVVGARGRKGLLSFALALFGLMGASQTAHAQDEGYLGLGAAQMLQEGQGVNPAGTSVQLVYDAGMWHAEGLVGASGGDTAFLIGGRGWFHLHATDVSDFSVGGGLGIAHQEDARPVDDDEDITSLLLDIGAQIRVFLVPNVTLSATAGIGVRTGDNDEDGFLFGGQLNGALAFTYFFR
jgi:hypothetical protein